MCTSSPSWMAAAVLPCTKIVAEARKGPGVSSADWGRAGVSGRRAEQVLAVAAAEQEGEPVQVVAQLLDAVGRVAGKLFQGRGQAAGVAGEPVAEELQHLG